MRVSALEPDDLPPALRHLCAPDDARALEADRQAYLREIADVPRGRRRFVLRRSGRREPPRFGPRARPERGDLAEGDDRRSPTLPAEQSAVERWGVGALVITVVAFMVVAAAIVMTVAPRLSARPDTLALSATTDAPIGSAGALLPAAQVQVNGGVRSLRDLRPSVLALWPQGGCADCAAALADASRAARSQGLRLIVAGSDRAAIRTAIAQAAPGSVALTDAQQALSVYRPTGLTLVAVHADGIVAEVIRDHRAGQPLDALLRTLASPGAAAR